MVGTMTLVVTIDTNMVKFAVMSFTGADSLKSIAKSCGVGEKTSVALLMFITYGILAGILTIDLWSIILQIHKVCSVIIES